MDCERNVMQLEGEESCSLTGTLFTESVSRSMCVFACLWMFLDMSVPVS